MTKAFVLYARKTSRHYWQVYCITSIDMPERAEMLEKNLRIVKSVKWPDAEIKTIILDRDNYVFNFPSNIRELPEAVQ